MLVRSKNGVEVMKKREQGFTGNRDGVPGGCTRIEGGNEGLVGVDESVGEELAGDVYKVVLEFRDGAEGFVFVRCLNEEL